jgi:hypothetical protein
MALNDHVIPYGLRDVKLTPINGDGSLGDPVDLPAGRTMSFTESEDFSELRGDDRVITSRGNGPSVTGDLEGGGISFDAWKTLSGGAVVSSGATPAEKKTFTKKATDSRPFFKAEGQAISDSGGDFHIVLYRCRATGDLTGTLADGEFLLHGASFTAFADPANSDKVYDFVANETAVAIVTS